MSLTLFSSFFLKKSTLLLTVNIHQVCAYWFLHTRTPPNTTWCKMPRTPPTSPHEGEPHLQSDVLMITVSPLENELCWANFYTPSLEKVEVPRLGPEGASDPRQLWPVVQGPPRVLNLAVSRILGCKLLKRTCLVIVNRP